MKLRPHSVVLMLASLAAGGHAEVEFAGYMRAPRGEDRFVLADSATKMSSEWIGIGASFGGYRVTRFEAKSETLTVEKDGESRQLRLQNSAMVAATKAPGATRAMPTADEIEETKMVGQLANAMQAKSYERDRLNQRASELRRSHPEDHPERQEVERKLMEVRQEMTRGLLEMDRLSRPALIRRIANSVGDPVALARAQGQLRSLDERLAKVGVVVEPAVPPIPSLP